MVSVCCSVVAGGMFSCAVDNTGIIMDTIQNITDKKEIFFFLLFVNFFAVCFLERTKINKNCSLIRAIRQFSINTEYIIFCNIFLFLRMLLKISIIK
jgi:hypothetical protein